jgi:dipeptidyl aminopeptidase/acylaminoacyl peptidase
MPRHDKGNESVHSWTARQRESRPHLLRSDPGHPFMNRILAGLLLGFALATVSVAENVATVAAPEAMVVDGSPPVPAVIAEAAARYGEARSASPSDWHPLRREMVIGTRFGNTTQAHLVSMPGGARQQLTFGTEPIYGGTFEPTKGEYMVVRKDTGGGEWFQLYRYDFSTGDLTLLTDGKSRNIAGPWSERGDRIAYTSTRRTGQDTDLWVIDPADPRTDRMVAPLAGGGWRPLDWSRDGSKILVREFISINESYLWLFDAASGERTALTPQAAGEKVAYSDARFSKDGKGIFFTADKDSEFQRLMYMDLATRQAAVLTGALAFDVDEFALSKDGHVIAFFTNENGQSALHLMNTATRKELPAPKMPAGLASGLLWHNNNRDLAFRITSAALPGDAFSLDIRSGKITRWTVSESAVKTDGFREPQLVRWKSFDGRTISGFLYSPPARFSGQRPVLINIHGGPEGQSRPGFLGRWNYYLNVLGIAIIEPNVRGSTGYGKTFTKLDNGVLREDSYRDIEALFDWIATRPDLDSGRICVTGGSYGGHMTLAIASLYSDRIRCSVDVVGMSNLVTFLEHTEGYRRDLRRVEYGDERDPAVRAFLERIAPMNNVGKIQKPMLVVAGKNDPRVPVSESNQIVDALKTQGTPVWYVMAKDEGHGFRKKANSDYQFYVTVEFLQKFLLD